MNPILVVCFAVLVATAVTGARIIRNGRIR
jgi:hypothetical protein